MSHDPTPDQAPAEIASPSVVHAELERQSTERTAALLAPLEAKAREVKARERAEHRAAVLREAIDVAREEGHRLEEQVGIEAARGARCVAYLLRKLLVKAQPDPRRVADEEAQRS